MAIENHDVAKNLAALLGPRGYTEDQSLIAPWLTDWRGRYTGRAWAMVSPADTQQVSALVALCAAHRIALVPQGGNSGMVAGATPDDSGDALLLSMRRMDMIAIDRIDEGLVLCGAGVILQSLHAALAEHGRRFPLTLGGKGSATVGGLISTNAGGTQVLRHGTMRALVAGLEAVWPDGTVLDGTAALKKDNRGYDLQQLLIGAEGTLGVVTRAALRTVPALIDRSVAWIGVPSPHAAYRLLRFLADRSGGGLEGFEIMPHAAVAATIDHLPGARWPLSAPHPWHVLAEWVQDVADAAAPAVTAQTLLADAFAAGLANDAVLSSSEAQASAFWQIRDLISQAERAHGPALQHDISVPAGRMADFITEACARVEARFVGVLALAFGHLGDGNVHFHVRAPQAVPADHDRFEQASAHAAAERWYREDGNAISALVYDMVEEYGGSISAEHGIGQAKAAELSRRGPPARLQAMARIKQALDPDGIMNPGKILLA